MGASAATVDEGAAASPAAAEGVAAAGAGSDCTVGVGSATAGAAAGVATLSLSRAKPSARARSLPGRVNSYTTPIAMMARMASGMAQRAVPGFECASAGNSPIARGVGASEGRSREGASSGSGMRREQGFGVEAQEARVVAREAADERAARQPREIVLFQRDHLPRRELQLLRDGVDRQARCRAGGTQAHARRTGVGRHGVGHRFA